MRLVKQRTKIIMMTECKRMLWSADDRYFQEIIKNISKNKASRLIHALKEKNALENSKI